MKTMILCCAVVLTSALQAAPTYNLDVEYTAGSGSNSAIIVVDFGLRAHSFQFNWNGAATGWDALNAIAQGGPLDIIAIDYGGWGMFIESLSYPNASVYNYGKGVIQGWAYYSSENGSDWYMTNGVSFRSLVNGSWDAYVWSHYDFSVSWDPLRKPGQPVPEPATMAFFVIGGYLLRKRLA
ncbi:MAG TPA: PEP-CTERM sorting domain-containing protein [Sedimentisphaerales bacterium]|nr:PEP-CTERM sorting domain-containing protein [Sedimentisphaerales bacterium]